MNIFTGLEKIVEKNYPLAKATWYGLGGPADYFITPQDTEQLKDVVKQCSENNIPIYVMGFGSNLLISDAGLRAAVIKLNAENFTKTEFDGEQLTAWAGTDLNELVLTCVKKGLSGIEALTGIPGSIGGAVRMNAGGNFGDIGAAVESVTLMGTYGKTF
jgi:UDP-N-acetylmuramate dehydrogenase